MLIYTFDPLNDSRWTEFLAKHPRASVFHSLPWLEALHETYGYQPIVYTSAPPGQALQNGIVFCRIKSWITGRRLVSLPFSDHCDPLLSDGESATALFAFIREDLVRQRMDYVEFRPIEELDGKAEQLVPCDSYCFHEIDLDRAPDVLFRSFHKDCVQRKIKRAAREGLIFVQGRSDLLLRHFYRLLLLTRRRHQIPPQPMAWYRNLIDCLGTDLKIWVAYKDQVPVASILTLQYKNKMVFKFGCSDPIGHRLGGVQFLLWESMQEARKSGLLVYDLGRSETTNTGLITFKDRWAPVRSNLTYWKYSAPSSSPSLININRTSLPMRFARHVFCHAPSLLLSVAGNLFYRHIG
jgi:CelD/BcsL family acetyltransferase involved in cellulose biosynthesis